MCLFSSKRLDYVNHARRLAEDDWTGMESEEEEDKKDDEEMDVDTGKKLPKRYANQVSSPGKVRPRSSPTEVNVAIRRGGGDRRKEWGMAKKLFICIERMD